MKKNKMMRIAGGLLIAVLLTTSIISGTFAKYVTTGSAADEARVARFGVTVTGSGSLFAKNYYSVKSGSSNNAAPDGTADDDNVVLTVESQTGEKIVAPGAKNDGTGLTFSLTGSPEVDVRISLSIDPSSKDIFLGACGELPDMTTSDNAEDKFNNPDTYYPIRYTLKSEIITTLKSDIDAANTGAVVRKNGTATGTLEQISKVLDVINGKDGGIYVDAGTNLNTVANGGLGDITLSWEWAFEDTSNDDAKKLQDQRDTLLGDLMYAKLDNGFAVKPDLPSNYTEEDSYYSLETYVKLVVTVTQVD